MSNPPQNASATALGTMMLQAINEVVTEGLPLTIAVVDAAGTTVRVTISLPPSDN
jgi:uncharacterized protein GlcG (DUF336 family)